MRGDVETLAAHARALEQAKLDPRVRASAERAHNALVEAAVGRAVIDAARKARGGVERSARARREKPQDQVVQQAVGVLVLDLHQLHGDVPLLAVGSGGQGHGPIIERQIAAGKRRPVRAVEPGTFLLVGGEEEEEGLFGSHQQRHPGSELEHRPGQGPRPQVDHVDPARRLGERDAHPQVGRPRQDPPPLHQRVVRHEVTVTAPAPDLPVAERDLLNVEIADHPQGVAVEADPEVAQVGLRRRQRHPGMDRAALEVGDPQENPSVAGGGEQEITAGIEEAGLPEPRQGRHRKVAELRQGQGLTAHDDLLREGGTELRLQLGNGFTLFFHRGDRLGQAPGDGRDYPIAPVR